MSIDVLNTGTAAGSGDGESLRSAMTKVNSNFGVAENAASKIVQASSADTTSDKVMLTDHAWRGAQLGDYFTYGGTANAITLTSANLRAGGTLIAGMKFRFKATATNTGATTIAVDGGSAIACVTPTGVALPAGFIPLNGDIVATYNGANFVVGTQAQESPSDSTAERLLTNETTHIGGEINYTGANYQPEDSNGIGVVKLCRNISGTTITSGSTFAGSLLRNAVANASGVVGQGALLSGTFKSVAGTDVPSDAYGLFVRIA